MNTSSVVLWLADVPWGYSLAGRWTALLVLAWLVHGALATRNPRWRVLMWRSAAVGLATIVLLTAAPPLVSWRLPRVEWIIVPEASSASVVPVADSLPVLHEGPARIADHRTAAAGAQRRSESAQRSMEVPALPPRKAAITAPSLGACLLAIWLSGVAVMAVTLGLCVWRVSRIVRRSAEVPPGVIEECRAVALALGCRQTVRVVKSAEVPTPCLTGLFRPRLLLPAGNCQETNRADLRAILAHELAHAARNDLIWNVVLHLVSILLWFHPLAWRMRAAHLAACDAVCDALAADLVGDVDVYGGILARLALQVAGPTHVPGLAMARTPDVFLRIEALKRRVFRRALPWRLIVPALLALVAAVILIGGSGITGADQPPPRKAPEADRAVVNAAPDKDAAQPASNHRLSVRVLSAKTGDPLDGVSVSCEIRGEGEPRKESVTTGKEGTAAIEWPAGITIRVLTLDVKKPGYARLWLYWDRRNQAISLPESQEARLEPGVPISGVVQDEAGKPIAQASVTAMATATEQDNTRKMYELGTTKTDEQGRWRIDDAPANVAGVSLHVHHPDYRRRPGQGEGGREWRTILAKGSTVKGRVVDRSGKPVKGAQVVDTGGPNFGGDRKPVATDELGAYTLRGCEASPVLVTAQAEGFGPEYREVDVPNQGEVEAPVIQLGKASTLRVRVVDRAGKPVAGAHVVADTWRGHRWSLTVRIQTDAAGRITWTSAPSDAVLFVIFKHGYMRKDLLPLTASDQEHVVKLDPELVISGSVTDAVTGKPMPRFRVKQGFELESRQQNSFAKLIGKVARMIQGLEVEGRQGILWENAAEYTGGHYSMKVEFPRNASYVRVEAPGYEPAESRAFRSDEGAMIQDFRLKPAAAISGVVLLPDGRPAVGVQVILGTPENRASVRDGVVLNDSNVETTTTGPDGRLTVRKRAGGFLIVVGVDAGFADATSDEFAKTRKLVLQPWGRIEGEVKIGRKPAAYQSILYFPESPSNRGDASGMQWYDYQFATDSQGRFAIDRVIPGRGQLARVLMNLRGEWYGQVPVEVKPGQTTKVRLGGKGRTVIGRVVLDGTPREPVDWRSNDAAVLELPRAERRKATMPLQTFASGFDKDGSFRIEDVAPGTYELKIPVSLPSDKTTCGPDRATMGEATLPVTVPDGPEDQPVEVGDVKVRVK
jgi:beta-lactamase regulating signal transducer with metallopeptidase domain